MDKRASQRRGRVSDRLRAQRGTPSWVWGLVVAIPLVGSAAYFAGRGQAPSPADPAPDRGVRLVPRAEDLPPPGSLDPLPAKGRPAVEQPEPKPPAPAFDPEAAIAKRAEQLLRAKLAGSSPLDEKAMAIFRKWARDVAERESRTIKVMVKRGRELGHDAQRIDAIAAAALADRDFLPAVQAPDFDLTDEFIVLFYDKHAGR